MLNEYKMIWNDVNDLKLCNTFIRTTKKCRLEILSKYMFLHRIIEQYYR